MGCQHLDDLYELYLLGALEVEESEAIAEHLARNCPYCLEHLREAAQTIHLITFLAPAGRPGQGLRARLLERVKKK